MEWGGLVKSGSGTSTDELLNPAVCTFTTNVSTEVVNCAEQQCLEWKSLDITVCEAVTIVYVNSMYSIPYKIF